MVGLLPVLCRGLPPTAAPRSSTAVLAPSFPAPTSAFHPYHVLSSTSSLPAAPVGQCAPVAAVPTAVSDRLLFTLSPSRCLEVHCTGSPTLPARVVDDAAPVDGCAPQSASPSGQAAAPSPPTHGMDDIDESSLPFGNSQEEEDEVDSYGSPFRSASPADTEEEEVDRDILWVPERDMTCASKIAYASIAEDGPVHIPAPFVHSALFSAAPGIHYRMFPSSRGHMLLCLDSMAERDYMVHLSPIAHDGSHVSLVRSEEGLNRFITYQPWLAALSATNFPDEHCTESGIPDAFRKLGTVVEIDSACLEGDSSTVRVVVARSSASRIPKCEFLGKPGKGANGRVLGSTFDIEVLRVWPRAEQLDASGLLRPFFPRPPGPGNGSGGAGLERFTDPPPFGPVYPGHVMGYPNMGFDGPGHYSGHPYFCYHLSPAPPLPPQSQSASSSSARSSLPPSPDLRRPHLLPCSPSLGTRTTMTPLPLHLQLLCPLLHAR